MIKSIKHLICINIITSLFVYSVISCNQTVTPDSNKSSAIVPQAELDFEEKLSTKIWNFQEYYRSNDTGRYTMQQSIQITNLEKNELKLSFYCYYDSNFGDDGTRYDLQNVLGQYRVNDNNEIIITYGKGPGLAQLQPYTNETNTVTVKSIFAKNDYIQFLPTEIKWRSAKNN